MGLYIVANADGNVISSTDGINWSEPFNTGILIGKAAVGPSTIVYTRSDVEEEFTPETGLYFTYEWNSTPVLAVGTDSCFFNEVHYLTDLFVAVGFYETVSGRRPAHAYSTDGVSWTVVQADEEFCDELAGEEDFELNDVAFSGSTWLIISSISGNLTSGAFATNDLSQPLGESSWIVNPYTSTVASISSSNPLTIILSGSDLPQDEEKIHITGATGLTDLNGYYYVEDLGEATFKLYSDAARLNAVDASGWSGTYDNDSATVTVNRLENFPYDANQVVYTSVVAAEYFTGFWSAFAEDQKSWFACDSADPSDPWNFFEGESDLSTILFDAVGLSDLNIAEATIGVLATLGDLSYVTWMVSTYTGQIIWWPHIPLGPFVSVPNPYTCTLNNISSLDPLIINVTIGSGVPLDNEKISISNGTGLDDINSVFFVESLGEGSYKLYTDVERNNAVDASAWSGTYDENSATITLSHGTFIDALGYGDGKFFAGNDDEEVFYCTSLNELGDLNWIKIDDQNNSLEYWNDVDYGPFQSCYPKEYVVELSPDDPDEIPGYKFNGEGNMDTAIVVDEMTGKRHSIQRTGYFELTDNCGNRRVVGVQDGATTSNIPNSVFTALGANLIQVNTPSVIYIFLNDTYVDYVPDINNISREPNNLMLLMDSLSISYENFTNIGQSAVQNVCNLADIIIIPELENGSLSGDLAEGTVGVLQNFVDEGGKIITFGDVENEYDLELLNAVFNFEISSLFEAGTVTLTEAGNALFSGLTENLSLNDATGALDPSTLPEGSVVIYESTSESSPVFAAELPYGSGKIYWLGYDWYDAAPNGEQDGGWNTLLEAILTA